MIFKTVKIWQFPFFRKLFYKYTKYLLNSFNNARCSYNVFQRLYDCFRDLYIHNFPKLMTKKKCECRKKTLPKNSHSAVSVSSSARKKGLQGREIPVSAHLKALLLRLSRRVIFSVSNNPWLKKHPSREFTICKFNRLISPSVYMSIWFLNSQL